MKKMPRFLMYVVGIPLAFIWLLTFIADTGWMLWGLVIVGLAAFIGAIYSVVQNSVSDPYQQYVRTHNEKAEKERARIKAKIKEKESESALIEMSDD